MLRTLRFFRQFLLPRDGAVVREETTYRRGDETLEASLYYPRGAGSDRPLPGWIALHGLTANGREHPSLDRFARAVAASGAVIMVPDLPAWRRLEVAPSATVQTIKAAVLELDRRPRTEPGRIGVIGFSFGATQALVAATDPALEGHLAGVVAWGGSADIRRSLRFAFLGQHELDGETHHLEPDPYGRWILAGNYLHLLEEHAGDRARSDALLWLAREAGRRGIMSWSPETDPLKREARRGLNETQRELFDLIAPPADTMLSPGERERLDELAGRLADAAVAVEPLLDPSSYLGRVPVPVVLAHGRGDRLMPWTELIRLRRALPAERVQHAAITSLFSHSFGERRLPTPGVLLEVGRFARLIHRLVRLI